MLGNRASKNRSWSPLSRTPKIYLGREEPRSSGRTKKCLWGRTGARPRQTRRGQGTWNRAGQARGAGLRHVGRTAWRGSCGLAWELRPRQGGPREADAQGALPQMCAVPRGKRCFRRAGLVAEPPRYPLGQKEPRLGSQTEPAQLQLEAEGEAPPATGPPASLRASWKPADLGKWLWAEQSSTDFDSPNPSVPPDPQV